MCEPVLSYICKYTACYNPRMKLIVANWKMHPGTLSEAKKLLTATKRTVTPLRGIKVIIAPPAVFLSDLKRAYRGGRIAFAAQTVHEKEAGTYTGELSACQIHDAGATYTLVGHAERRAMGETNEQIAEKVGVACNAGLQPILCIGEGKRDTHGDYLAVLRQQLQTALAAVPKHKRTKLVVAYEPVWAIGAETAMKPDVMHRTALFIRKILVEHFGRAAFETPVLYGGSVDAENAADMLHGAEVDGLLVGRASIEQKRFAGLLKAVAGT